MNEQELIDELERIQNIRKDLDAKEEELKNQVITIAKQKNISFIFGKHKKCVIRAYEKITYPEDKEQLIELIKRRGLYPDLSMLNYSRLSSRIVSGNLDKEIIELVKKEQAFRLTLIDRGV